MNYTKEKFHHTISVLVSSYLNGTLAHSNCYACAVGNLVADGLGCKVMENDCTPKHCKNRFSWSNGEEYPGEIDNEEDLYGWGAAFSTSDNPYNGRKKQDINKMALNYKRVQNHIEATGYEWHQLARIEKAFESADRRKKDVMFDGLMRVVDVLVEIHGMNETEKIEAKAMFVKA